MARITTRFRGGGAKRRYRIIDFRRDKDDVAATVRHIEYDLIVQRASLCWNMQTARSVISA